MGLVRPCGEVEVLGEADGLVEKRGGKAQSNVGAVIGSFSVPQIDILRGLFGRLEWVHGGFYLGGYTRHESDGQEKPTS